MSDDLSRQRFWSWNNAKPEVRSPCRPAQTRRIRSRPGATHVLLVRPAGRRDWCILVDAGRDMEGSEAFCVAEMATRARHFPSDEFCVLPWSEARRELRRKTWSVNDEDHIPVDGKVMLRRAPAEIHPGLVKMHEAFGLSRESEQRRLGVVMSRHHRSGDYMVRLDGTEVTVCVARDDLIYPVPDNVVPLELRRAR